MWNGWSTLVLFTVMITSVEVHSMENYALRRPTFQSSVGWGGVPSRAVDGNTRTSFSSGSCAHTDLNDAKNTDTLAWWGVDLQRPRLVTSFEITNRDDSMPYEGDRLFDFIVAVGYHNSSDGNDICYFYNGTLPKGATEHIQCNQPVYGRFAFLKKTRAMDNYQLNFLELCEMKIFGQDFAPVVSYASPVVDGLVYRSQNTFLVGNVISANKCHVHCQRHAGCTSFIVTAIPGGVYNCELNDNESSVLQIAEAGSQCYLFEPHG